MITGVGVVAPNAIGRSAFWDALKEGRSGIKKITLFDTSSLASHYGGQVPEFDPSEFLPKKRAPELGRSAVLSLYASLLALDDSGFDHGPARGSQRKGVAVGIVFPATDLFFHLLQKPKGYAEDWHSTYSGVSSNVSVMEIIEATGFGDSAITINTACTSGLNAIGHAFREIQKGAADIYLAGGTDATLNAMIFAGLISSGLQTTDSLPPEKLSRPFDKRRSTGIVSEGACILVVEDAEQALKRGAPIYAEIRGYGSVGKTFAPDYAQAVRKGMATAMQLALNEAEALPEDVDFISAHAPSHRLLDAAETLAIKDVFGRHAYTIPVSSIKSMVGNPMASSGPMQIAGSLLAINQSIISPTVNLDNPDDDCDLDYVPNLYRLNKVDRSLINSHGVDGSDASILIARYE